jgi:hypothetical protein
LGLARQEEILLCGIDGEHSMVKLNDFFEIASIEFLGYFMPYFVLEIFDAFHARSFISGFGCIS